MSRSTSNPAPEISVMSGTAQAIKHIENERVIVTEYRFAPGANTGWHRHGHDYVVVPLMDGRLKIVSASGETFAEMKKGAPYSRPPPVEPAVITATPAHSPSTHTDLKC
jgi:quercetin dioxygenase-like cupin family protein